MDYIKEIGNIGILPVVKINDANKAVPLAKALIKGGLSAAEITFRTDEAEEAIKRISKECPGMFVGAGTVLTIEQAKRAKDAGAKFIVSPGFNPKVVQWCIDNGILMAPGITSPSEIELAMEMGLNVVKFFPAEQAGGIDKINAMAAPYSNVKFMPTGGIGLDNLTKYITNKKILACGGSFMVKADYIDNEDWDRITEITKNAVKIMLGFEIGHIGVNCEDEKDAKNVATLFSNLLDIPCERDSAKSVFVGSEYEIMKGKNIGKGKNGHICILTNSVDRTVYHLSKKGIEFDFDTAVYNSDGSMKFIYLKNEIGGFGIHFNQR